MLLRWGGASRRGQAGRGPGGESQERDPSGAHATLDATNPATRWPEMGPCVFPAPPSPNLRRKEELI